MKRITAATLAAATAMSLAAAPAQADEALERAKFLGILAVKGTGAAPDTEPVGKMVVGSIKAGSSAEEAYKATQAGWIITWIAVAATGLGALAFGAKQVGLLKF